jgi:hypothetical protein
MTESTVAKKGCVRATILDLQWVGLYCLILGFATEYSTSVRKFTAT